MYFFEHLVIHSTFQPFCPDLMYYISPYFLDASSLLARTKPVSVYFTNNDYFDIKRLVQLK